MSQQKKSSRWNRRDFVKTTSLAAGALAFGVPTLLRAKNLNSKLNIASIGAMGNKGPSDTDACAGENIVALCDVDSGSEGYAKQMKKYPTAKFYQNFRQMLDEMGKEIDAVTVSTPDHLHAIAATAVMQMDKHVFCQKPLTQTIYEARYLRKMANEKKIVTQMGNQGSAADGLRRAVETIQSITRSSARSIGARIRLTMLVTASLTRPRPTRRARKLITSVSSPPMVCSTLLAAAPMAPLAIAEMESMNAATTCAICRRRSTRNMIVL